jgi:ABC-type nitrate/sulfonate/bicarbonate transport system substrate-binding protein
LGLVLTITIKQRRNFLSHPPLGGKGEGVPQNHLLVFQGFIHFCSIIADLKGKKIAAEEGTVDRYLLLLGLKKEGLSAKDIEFVPLETGKAATAFVAGQLDGERCLPLIRQWH